MVVTFLRLPVLCLRILKRRYRLALFFETSQQPQTCQQTVSPKSVVEFVRQDLIGVAIKEVFANDRLSLHYEPGARAYRWAPLTTGRIMWPPGSFICFLFAPRFIAYFGIDLEREIFIHAPPIADQAGIILMKVRLEGFDDSAHLRCYADITVRDPMRDRCAIGVHIGFLRQVRPPLIFQRHGRVSIIASCQSFSGLGGSPSQARGR